MSSSESSGVVRFSEIEAFWLNTPAATDTDIHEFTGTITKRLCDCGLQLRRFECWNGLCEMCRSRLADYSTDKLECGCMIPSDDGGFWESRHGWHYRGPVVYGRCPKFWEAHVGEAEMTKKRDGKAIKFKVTVRYHVDPDDRMKIVATYYDNRGTDVTPRAARGGDYGA